MTARANDGGARREPQAQQTTPASPSTQPQTSESCKSRHVVASGDTLWDIAAMVLQTNDPVRIARYWPRIHRLNRAVIGRDPNLIVPGQVLELPDECN
jgi:nucleoid-associated protein YgaU